MKNQYDWNRQLRIRKITTIVLVALLFVGAGVLIFKDNLNKESLFPEHRHGIHRSLEKRDNKEIGGPSKYKEKIKKEYIYSYRLDSCIAAPADEKRLKLYVALDLQFNSSSLLKEIDERKNDLRILVNMILSSRKVEEIAIPGLRHEEIKKLNSLLENGKIIDVRFIDFRIKSRV